MTAPPDVALITVVAEFELPAAARVFRFNLEKPDEIDENGTRYWSIAIKPSFRNKNLQVLVTCIGEAGIDDAGAFCGRLFAKFKPSLAILCGIAAGIREKVNLGDVVLSDLVMGYESRRLSSRNEPRFAWKSPPYRISNELTFVERVARQKWLALFGAAQRQLSEAEIPNVRTLRPRVHFGTIASGNKLVADGMFRKLRAKYHEPIRAGEMEAIGFAKAAEQAGVAWIVVRGISDFGDPETKEHPKKAKKKRQPKDDFHPTASNSGAAFSRAILEHASSALFSFPKRETELGVKNDADVRRIVRRIVDVARSEATLSAKVRRELYDLADQWESSKAPDPSALLLAEKYALEMDYAGGRRNLITVSLFSLSKREVKTFEETLTGTVPIANEDLALKIADASRRGIYLQMDEVASTAKKKRVMVHFPALQRGQRVKFALQYDWCGHTTATINRWHDFFLEDFLVCRADLRVRSKSPVHSFDVVSHSLTNNEPNVLDPSEVEVKRRADYWQISLLRPYPDRNYRINFQFA